jgi:DNA polymerase-3 subunit alpha
MWTAKVQLNIDAQRTDKAALADLKKVLRRHPGDCQGVMTIRTAENVQAIVSMAEHWRLQPGEALSREVNGLLGYPAVETLCGEIRAAETNGRKRRYRGR